MVVRFPLLSTNALQQGHISRLGECWWGRKDKENDTGKENKMLLPIQGLYCLKSTQSQQVQQDTYLHALSKGTLRDFPTSNQPYFIIASVDLLTFVIPAPLLSTCVIKNNLFP